MKNTPFAYQSQTGEWSIFIMNVENVSLKTESQSYKSLTKLKLMKTFIPNRSLEKVSCHFLMTAIRKIALYMLDS